jgi:glycosyltransferase involved in cell wall biosynthesis
MPADNSSVRVSVIIPTYNRSQLLRQTVESVLAQTYSNIEVIVVDDGSTDDTAAVMEQFAGKVTYIQEAHGSGGRNRGFRTASGEYINFLDHDDLMLPAKIERQVRVLDTRPEVGLVHCGHYVIDEGGNRLTKTGILPEGNVLKDLVCGNFLWSGAPLIRRRCVEEVGGFSKDWASDWDMWLRIARAGYSFACVQMPLGAYRITSGSQMSSVSRLEEGSFAILDRIFSDPRLPAEVAAVKSRAYGTMRFFVGCRYYTVGQWDDGRKNLAEALALRPDLAEHPMNLLGLLADDALSPRVGAPLEFVRGVLDHLPPAAEGLLPYRTRLYGRVYVGLSLRSYGVGNTAEAKPLLAEAVATDPALLEQPESFAMSLAHYAVRLPVSSPRRYVETVFDNLPPEAQCLARVRSRVLGDVIIGSAFADYFAGRRGLVIRGVLNGLQHRPALLRNRGVLSILMKSLIGQRR